MYSTSQLPCWRATPLPSWLLLFSSHYSIPPPFLWILTDRHFGVSVHSRTHVQMSGVVIENITWPVSLWPGCREYLVVENWVTTKWGTITHAHNTVQSRRVMENETLRVIIGVICNRIHSYEKRFYNPQAFLASAKHKSPGKIWRLKN